MKLEETKEKMVFGSQEAFSINAPYHHQSRLSVNSFRKCKLCGCFIVSLQPLAQTWNVE